jgi:hypothetical protein
VIPRSSRRASLISPNRSLRRLIEEDGGSNIDVYNDCLRPGLEGKDDEKPWTWFKTSWLFAECYLSVMVRP